ncbi:putative serine/threonine-protein kinase PBL28 [Bidens hawaiensis]|uniref:putative serine/threonine-protein kinase PBL28 n=1 Tax=Bidens hawaiensis TaxID=980011 RepID=UPI00404A8E1F
MASTLHTKLSHLQIPLEDVLNATNTFHQDNLIGHGGLGTAYKGQLLRSVNLIKISALRLDHRKQGDGDVEFWTEISMLSDLNHPNIVSIVGFCDEKHEKVIITTYAAKGSLEKHLDNPNLTWPQRLKICAGVARALTYLHHDEGRDYVVIRLNINSTSILLDENLEPKLSGFKVSVKQSVNRMDRVILSEPIVAMGYVDPEIGKSKGVTHKSDIYSFGVVLFELLCGRRAYIKNGTNRFLAGLAKYHYEKETLQDNVYPDLRNQISPYSLRIYSKMAYSCLEKERVDRPNILIIVDKLEKALKQTLKFKPNFGKNLEHLKIQLNDIKLATNNFSDKYKIGSNNYHTWYSVELGHFDNENTFSIEGKSISELSKRHNTIVIKRFLPVDEEEEEEIFFTELEMLSSVKHHNLVNLLGFCVDGYDMMIVV